MKYRFKLEKEDFVRFQLYLSSKSSDVKKRRLSNQIWIAIIFAILSLIFYREELWYPSIFCGVFAVLTLLFYQRYLRNFYRKHFEKHVEQHLAERFGLEVGISFEEDIILSKSEFQESKINFCEVSGIDEVTESLYIHIKTGETYIIPKEIKELDSFREELSELSKKFNVYWNENYAWKWK